MRIATPYRVGFVCWVALASYSVTELTLAQTVDASRDAITLVTPDVTKVIRLDSEERASLRLTGPLQGRLAYEVESFAGETISENADVLLDDGETQSIEFPASIYETSGIRWVRAEVKDADKAIAAFRGALACMEPARDKRSYEEGDFIFGIAYGASPDNLSPIAAKKSALIGITMLRSNPRWNWTQPKADQWDWSKVDELTKVHDREGIGLQPLVNGTPRWAALPSADGKNHGGGSSPPDPEAWRVWTGELAKRLKGKARYWEIWNEPDIGFFTGTQEQYFAMLETAYEQIKAVDPAAVVMTGGFVSMVHHGRKPLMVERLLADHHGHFDMIAYHTHGHFANFREELDDRLLPYCKQVLPGPRPLYFTETGMDTRMGERYQAITLPKKIVFAWSRGAVAYTWFSLHDHPNVDSSTKPGFTYGLCTSFRKIDPAQSWTWENMNYDTACPKASYVALNTVTSVLHGARFVRQIELGQDCFVFEFIGRDGNGIDVLWRETKDSDTFDAVLSSDKDLRRVDLMGNVTTVAVEQGKATVTVGSEPFFVCGAESTPIRFIEARGVGTKPFAKGTLELATGDLPSTPQLKLNSITQVVNLSEHDPHTAHLLWQGPHDLSADVRIVHDDEGLCFQIDVQDDVFDWTRNELAERDRIELALRSTASKGYWLIHISGDPTKQSGRELPQIEIESFGDAPKVPADAVTIQGKGGGHRRTYQVELPDDAFPLSDDIEMNLAVWDADGKGVGGWLEATPGMKQLRKGDSSRDVWLKLVP
jgi:hypothetical protein